MAPRATWKGYLKLSLVSCPVRLYNATSATDRVTFNWLHKDTHNRIQMKPVDPELGLVERADLVKGYEFEKDQYVVIEDEDLEQVQIESSKTIVIDEFIDADGVDPLYLDAPYFVAPDGPVAEETFCVVREAMRRRNKAALARVVLSSRERVCVLGVRDRGMVLTTARNAREVRAPSEYFSEIPNGDVDAEMLKLAELIIDQNAGTFDAGAFVDRYQVALQELVKAKIKGKKPIIAKSPERGKVINLMDALRQSLDASARKKPPAASKARAQPPAAAKTAGKAPAKAAAKTRRRKSA